MGEASERVEWEIRLGEVSGIEEVNWNVKLYYSVSEVEHGERSIVGQSVVKSGSIEYRN